MRAKLLIVMLTSAVAMLSSACFADDDDGDEKRRKKGRRASASKTEIHHHHHHHYYYLPSAVAERDGSPPVAAEKDVPLALKRPRAMPERFPKETRMERDSATERQRDLLEKELAAELDLLLRARKGMAVEDAERHERNIAALRRELNQLQR